MPFAPAIVGGQLWAQLSLTLLL